MVYTATGYANVKNLMIYDQKAVINTVILQSNVSKAFNSLYWQTQPLSITDIKPTPYDSIGSVIIRSDQV